MSALIIIRPHTLQVYYSDHNAPVGIPLPESIVSDMEVINEEELSTLLTKQLKSTNPGNTTQTILVLSDELCFVDILKEKEEEAITKQLISNTPFVHVATGVLRTEKESLVIATNQDFYETLAKLLGTIGFSVATVVSWRGFVQSGATTNGEVDNVTVKRAFDLLSQLKTSAFPLSIDQIPKEKIVEPNAGKQPAKKLPIGWIIFGALALLYALGMIIFMLRR